MIWLTLALYILGGFTLLCLLKSMGEDITPKFLKWFVAVFWFVFMLAAILVMLISTIIEYSTENKEQE